MTLFILALIVGVVGYLVAPHISSILWEGGHKADERSFAFAMRWLFGVIAVFILTLGGWIGFGWFLLFGLAALVASGLHWLYRDGASPSAQEERIGSVSFWGILGIAILWTVLPWGEGGGHRLATDLGLHGHENSEEATPADDDETPPPPAFPSPEISISADCQLLAATANRAANDFPPEDGIIDLQAVLKAADDARAAGIIPADLCTNSEELQLAIGRILGVAGG